MQSNSFKKLQAEWDKKLKESGFKDIETRDERLIEYSNQRFQRKVNGIQLTPEIFQAKAEYFRAAEAFLSNYEFENNEEVKIWELHCTGMSLRNISKNFKGVKINSIWKIRQTLKKLIKEMKASWLE